MLLSRRVTRGVERRRSHLSFLGDWEQEQYFLGKNVFALVIDGLNFSFKVQFQRFSRRNRDFPLQGFCFLVVDGCLSKSPNSRKTSLP